MRRDILKILRDAELQSSFHNRYSEYFEDFDTMYEVEEYLDFPNYRYLINRYNELHPNLTESGLITVNSGNGIKAELRRMELDRLVMIGTQKGVRHAHTDGRKGPDFDNEESTTESIILTTRGKSVWKYYWADAIANPLNWVAFAISVASLLISIRKS